MSDYKALVQAAEVFVNLAVRDRDLRRSRFSGLDLPSDELDRGHSAHCQAV
jgi:hypothetical protein